MTIKVHLNQKLKLNLHKYVMLHIKRFFDRLTAIEGRQAKDIVMPIADARGLRDDIGKLLMDLRSEDSLKEKEVVQIQIKGGSFK